MILESYQTHISEPVVTSDKSNYKVGEKISVSGLVYYNEELTSDVLLRIILIDSLGQEIFESYVKSEIEGAFSTDIPIKTNTHTGEYEIKVISQCREIHRQICTHQFDTMSITIVNELEQSRMIPLWIKNNAGWWASGEINDDTFLQGIEFLIENGILTISYSRINNTTEIQEIPLWIKNNAGWWASGEINDDTFLQGIEFLIENGILKIK